MIISDITQINEDLKAIAISSINLFPSFVNNDITAMYWSFSNKSRLVHLIDIIDIPMFGIPIIGLIIWLKTTAVEHNPIRMSVELVNIGDQKKEEQQTEKFSILLVLGYV